MCVFYVKYTSDKRTIDVNITFVTVCTIDQGVYVGGTFVLLDQFLNGGTPTVAFYPIRVNTHTHTHIYTHMHLYY